MVFIIIVEGHWIKMVDIPYDFCFHSLAFYFSIQYTLKNIIIINNLNNFIISSSIYFFTTFSSSPSYKNLIYCFEFVVVIILISQKIKIIKKSKRMGTGKSKQHIYYDPTINAQLFDQTNQCKFYRNQRGEEFEKYKVQNKGNEDFQNRYDYRIRHSSPYLVDAYSAKAANNAFGCTAGNDYEVVTERIPTRLYDLNNLSASEGLNIVHKSLKGFQQIYKSQGVMLVKDSMIGLNKQNNVKVWMNSNFALNQIQQPPISYGVLPQMQKESTMVDNIIQLINSRSKRDPQWIDFVDDKYRQGRIGFDQAIKLTENHLARVRHAKDGDVNEEYQHCDLTNSIPKQSFNAKMNESYPQPIHHQSNIHSRQWNSGHNSSIHHGSMSINPAFHQTTSLSNNFRANSHHSQRNFVPQLQPPISRPSMPSTMANLKNKIIGKDDFTFKNQSSPRKVMNNVLPNTPMNPNSVNFPINKFPVDQRLIQPPPRQNMAFNNQIRQPPFENRAIFPQPSNLRPRPLSQGKPVVTFGSKSFGSYAPSSVNPSINNKPINFPTVGAINTPTFNRSFESNFKPAIAPPFSGNPPPQPFNNPPKFPVPAQARQNIHIPEVKTNITSPSPVQPNMKIAFVPPFPINKIPPPLNLSDENVQNSFQIGNLQNGIQVTESQHQQIQNHNITDNTMVNSVEDRMIKPIQPIKIEDSRDLYHSLPQKFQQSPQLRKIETFGDNYAEDTTEKQECKVQNHIIIETDQKEKIIQEYQTPVFNREKILQNKKQLFGVSFNKKNSLSGIDQILQQDQMLEDEKQEQDHIKQQTLAQKVQITPEINIKEVKQVKQENRMSDRKENIVNPSLKSSRSAAKIQQKVSQNVKQEVNFKKAVHQNASNIRMQSSKISIKSSSDLKGVISYKDLRQLLKSTVKKHNE